MFKLCVYFLQDRGLHDRNLQPYFLFRDDGFKINPPLTSDTYTIDSSFSETAHSNCSLECKNDVRAGKGNHGCDEDDEV